MELEPGQVTLENLEKIYRQNISPTLKDSFREAVEASASFVQEASKGLDAIYGLNTGFGKLASVKIDKNDTEKLQHKLILSHCCGVGEPINIATTRLMMILKLISLGRGASGVRWEVCQQIEKMIAADVIPIIPSQGSVGASGDLAPLAHMSAVMLGEGEAFFKKRKLGAKEALFKAGLSPITLGPKEGLALINGTQFSTALALVGLFEAFLAVENSAIISVMSLDAIMGSTTPLRAEIHHLRGHKGQIWVANRMRALIKGSQIRESHRKNDDRVQDPYCLRCQPQVLGAVKDVLDMTSQTLQTEANAVTDNPIVLCSEKEILSGGNFHAEPIGFAADQIALALAEIGSISQRRVALMVDPALNHQLPPFLTPEPGLNSGYMIAEVTAAALMSENKFLATPCVTDSTPTSANQEDHVSMSAHGAYRLVQMNRNLTTIQAIELLCASQGIEARLPLLTSKKLQSVIKLLRQHIPSLEQDRYMAPDIEKASEIVASDLLVTAVSQAD